MDAYPESYTEHNHPLVFLLGLGDDHVQDEVSQPSLKPSSDNVRLSSQLPSIASDRAGQLLQEFLKLDASDRLWNGKIPRGGTIGYRVKDVGRSFPLPARKAHPPPESPPSSPPMSPTGRQTGWVLHSPLSPLSPGAPTFPDGVMTPLWIRKHQEQVPSVLLAFFDMPSNENTAVTVDNHIKEEIRSIRDQLSRSGYHIRLAAVVLTDHSVQRYPALEERILNIGRASGLSPKSSLFSHHTDCSPGELAQFAATVCQGLQATCIDYYRDLTKHARRKKNRGSAPPPTAPPTRGTSQVLSSQGWGVRYEFKLGIFAEFRQEMDVAGRHYTFAFDALLGPDGTFETTPSWSPRWDEARLLADCIALRIIRCLLWNNMPSSAAQSWTNYRDRMRDLIDRRGRGTSTYGWEAWEARWAKIMAEIILRVAPDVFDTTSRAAVDNALDVVYAQPEKLFLAGERFPPWQFLHHPGYWHQLSAYHSFKRKDKAEEIPWEDRVPPGQSPARQVASRQRTYDTYLCPEPHEEFPLPGRPGFDHVQELLDTLNKAVSEFHSRGQYRTVEHLNLQIGKSLNATERYQEALIVLKPLWDSTSWRSEGWWSLVEDLSWALHSAACQVGNAETVVAAEWELMHKDFTPREKHAYNIAQCLDFLHPEAVQSQQHPNISVSSTKLHSFLEVTFAFGSEEAHVSEPLTAQLSITSHAYAKSAPVQFSEVLLEFEGVFGQVVLRPDGSEDDSTSRVQEVRAEGDPGSASSRPSLTAFSNLTIAPGQTRAFLFKIMFREAGEARALRALLKADTDRFNLQCEYDLQAQLQATSWWLSGSRGLKAKRISREAPAMVKVLPKPPKMEVVLPGLRSQYYTDETITLELGVENNEDEETDSVLDVRLLGHDEEAIALEWATPSASDGNHVRSDDADLPGYGVGRLSPGATRTQTIRFKAPHISSDYVLEAKILYHLLSDPETPLSKIVSVELVFSSPFEANYDFPPRIHPDPWPNYFSTNTIEAPVEGEPAFADAKGIVQRWSLESHIVSFASQDLMIHMVQPILIGANGGAIVDIKESSHIENGILMHPQCQANQGFIIDVKKMSLEDRRSVALDLELAITWSRVMHLIATTSDETTHTHTPAQGDSHTFTSVVPVPRLVIPGGEPRVVCTAAPLIPAASIMKLTYTIENPSLHFLTFTLSMEASEEFAFSGTKLGTINLLPFSRASVDYRIMAIDNSGSAEDGGDTAKSDGNGRWVLVNLRVMDRYFNKTLKALPGEGCKNDRKGVLVWIPRSDG